MPCHSNAASSWCVVAWTCETNLTYMNAVPPQTPKILNERGEQIQSRVGPLEEGNDLVLVCVVMGGIPSPQVTWSTQGKSLMGTMLDFSFVSALNNKLVIKNLSRVHQHAVYTCHASNFPKTDVTANVTIEMYCKSTYIFHSRFLFLSCLLCSLFCFHSALFALKRCGCVNS